MSSQSHSLSLASSRTLDERFSERENRVLLDQKAEKRAKTRTSKKEMSGSRKNVRKDNSGKRKDQKPRGNSLQALFLAQSQATCAALQTIVEKLSPQPAIPAAEQGEPQPIGRRARASARRRAQQAQSPSPTNSVADDQSQNSDGDLPSIVPLDDPAVSPVPIAPVGPAAVPRLRKGAHIKTGSCAPKGSSAAERVGSAALSGTISAADSPAIREQPINWTIAPPDVTELAALSKLLPAPDKVRLPQGSIESNFRAAHAEYCRKNQPITLAEFHRRWCLGYDARTDLAGATCNAHVYRALFETKKLYIPAKYASAVKQVYSLVSEPCDEDQNPHHTNGKIRSHLSYLALLRLYRSGVVTVHDLYGSDRTVRHFWKIRIALNVLHANYLFRNLAVVVDEADNEVVEVPVDADATKAFRRENPLPLLRVYGAQMSPADTDRRTHYEDPELCVGTFDATEALLLVNVYMDGDTIVTPESIAARGFLRGVWIGHTFPNRVGYVPSWPENAYYYTYVKDGIHRVRYAPDMSGASYDHPVLDWPMTPGSIKLDEPSAPYLSWSKTHSLTIKPEYSQWGATTFDVVDFAPTRVETPVHEVSTSRVTLYPIRDYTRNWEFLVNMPKFITTRVEKFFKQRWVPIPHVLKELALTKLQRAAVPDLNALRAVLVEIWRSNTSGPAAAWQTAVNVFENDPNYPFARGASAYAGDAAVALFQAYTPSALSTAISTSIASAQDSHAVSRVNRSFVVEPDHGSFWRVTRQLTKVVVAAASVLLIIRCATAGLRVVQKTRLIPALLQLSKFINFVSPLSILPWLARLQRKAVSMLSFQTASQDDEHEELDPVWRVASAIAGASSRLSIASLHYSWPVFKHIPTSLITDIIIAPLIEESIKRTRFAPLMLLEPLCHLLANKFAPIGFTKALYSVTMHTLLALLPYTPAVLLHSAHNAILTGEVVPAALSLVGVAATMFDTTTSSTNDQDINEIYARGDLDVDLSLHQPIETVPGATVPAPFDGGSIITPVSGPIELVQFAPATRGPFDYQSILIQHPVTLIKPVNNLVNQLSLVQNRLAKPSPMCPEVRQKDFDARKWVDRWGFITDLEYDKPKPVFEWSYDEQHDSSVWLSHMTPSKAKLYRNVINHLREHPLSGNPIPNVFKRIDINVKADEKLVNKNKFRPIHAVAPAVTAVLGPHIYQFSKHLKEIFSGKWSQARTFKHKNGQVLTYRFNFLIATDCTPKDLSRWYSETRESMENQTTDVWVAAAVAGDDNVTLINFCGKFFQFEADASSFDHSQTLFGYLHSDEVLIPEPELRFLNCPAWRSTRGPMLGTGLLGVQLKIFEEAGFPFRDHSPYVDSSANMAQLITASFTADCVLTRARSKTHHILEDPVVVHRPLGERNTGGTDTSIGNSVISLQILMWKVLKLGPDLERITEPSVWFGVSMKTKVSSHPTFLKGIWVPAHVPYPYVWVLLPSRLIKMGSTLANLEHWANKEISAQTAMISAIAKSYCPYPMIEPMRDLMSKWARLDSKVRPAPFEHGLYIKPDQEWAYTLDEMEAALVMIRHYGLPLWDLYDFFFHLEDITSFPARSGHPVWNGLTADYLSLPRVAEKLLLSLYDLSQPMSEIIYQQRAPRKAQRILNALLVNKELSPSGLKWLFNAVDPFHDTQIDATGWPDGQNNRSVCSVIRKTITLTRPAALSGQWDARIDLTPYMCGDHLQQYVYAAGQIPLSSTGLGARFCPGVSINCGAMGFNINDPNVYSESGAELPPPARVDTARRITAVGFEVNNVTPEMYKGGSVTVYRAPGQNRQVLLTNGSSIPWTFRWLGSLPVDLETISSLPDSKTWDAAAGVYVVGAHEENVNEPGIFDFQQVLLPTQAPAISGSVYADQIGSITDSRANTLNYSGAYFSGLDANAVLTITVKYFIEDFPQPSNTSLYTLTKPTAAYDATALEIYSRAVDEMPVGVPVGENPLGEWFDTVMNIIGAAAPVAGALFGAPGAALGSALATASKAAAELNAQGRARAAATQQARGQAKKPSRKSKNKQLRQKQPARPPQKSARARGSSTASAN